MGNPAYVFGTADYDGPDWRNIIAVYDGTSELERRRGREWYRNAWRFSRALAETHWHAGTQRRTIQAAGILAALAQNTGWDRNMELALETFAAKGELAGGTFASVRDKCSRIFQGERPELVLGGPKITAFYACIAAQGDCDDVCVDRHAAHIAMGRPLSNEDRARLLRVNKTYNGYGRFVEAYRLAAHYINQRDSEDISPAQLQATVWVAWRAELLGEDRGFRLPQADESLAS